MGSWVIRVGVAGAKLKEGRRGDALLRIRGLMGVSKLQISSVARGKGGPVIRPKRLHPAGRTKEAGLAWLGGKRGVGGG